MVDHRCFPGVPPVTDREPVALNIGDRININGAVLFVRGTSVAFDHTTGGPTAGVIDLAPLPKPAKPRATMGEVWRGGYGDEPFLVTRAGEDHRPLRLHALNGGNIWSSQVDAVETCARSDFKRVAANVGEWIRQGQP